MKAFIERFRYKATKAVQVQQKVKQLEKIVPVVIDEVDNAAMHLKFPPCLRSGDYPVICDEVSKSYGEHLVFANTTLTIKRGEKVAFVGKNGEGKTTLVKCIMGEIPFDGMLKIGHNVQIGYFAQNQAQLLDENLTVYQTIDNVARGDIRLRINDILGAFMFGGETADKRVKVLSGGERSRLAMIRLLLEPVNLLILDEPTNHLDMPSKDVLKEAIRAFDGTAIIVSHDREFLDGLVTKVYEFGGGQVREHLGGIYDFLRNRSENIKMRGERIEFSPANAQATAQTLDTGCQRDARNQKSQPESRTPATGGTQDTANTTKLSYAEHKEQQKRRNRAEKAVKESERKIEDMEQRLKELDGLLCDPKNASDMTLVTEYTSTKHALDEEVDRWERLSEELEQLK
jgi:ATP-binding cassette subfamily F protein 3